MPDPLPPIDTNVKVPRGVVASSAKADEIHKAAYPDAASSEGAPAAPTNVEATQPQPTNPTPPPPHPPPLQPNPPQPPPASPVPQETAEDWKQRYSSLKGRFDQQSGQLANTNARLASLESLVSTLQRPAPPTQQPASPQKSFTKRVTDEEVKEYGEDMIKMVQKAALDAVEPILEQRVSTVRNEVQTDLRKTEGKLGTVEREASISAHQRLLDYLDKNSVHWRALNRHPKFHTWLGLTDPLSGAIRKSLLDDAVRRGDAARAATFYDRFLAEEGSPAPAQGQPSSQPPPTNGGNGAPKMTLESLAAPGRPAASGAAPTVPETKEIITRAQISTFYNAKNKGQYSAEEAKRLEAEIFAAQKEGRIR